MFLYCLHGMYYYIMCIALHCSSLQCAALPCLALHCTLLVSVSAVSLFPQIRLRETNFYVGSLAGRAATHTDLLGVLLNVAEWSVSTAFAMNNVSHGFSATTTYVVLHRLCHIHPNMWY